MTTTLTPITDDGFVEATRNGKRKHAFKARHIDGVRLTKQKPNYFNRPVGKSANVHGEASTSQPKKTVHTNTQPDAKKDDMYETDKLDWHNSNNSESNVNDSDSEEVMNVFVKDNEKPIDGLVDDARKKVEASLKKTP
nr:hypothetical protein [Tanacetum cinerariifolium]